jgi:hypothetical protein
MFMRNLQLLREYIRRLLEDSEEVKDDLLTEPDDIEERDDSEVDEFSGVAAVAGVTGPVGAGPKHSGYASLKKKQSKKNRK